MAIDAKTLIQKANMTVQDLIDDGGYLAPEQFDKFYRKLMEGPSNLIKEIRTVPMKNPQMEIDKIGFGTRMLRVAPTAGTAMSESDRYTPQYEKVELMTHKFMGTIFLPYDVLEDNIERGRLQQTILDMAAQRVNKDLSELIILGDTTNTADSYLATIDGVLKQAAHQVDAGTAITAIDKTLFKTALNAMPSKYLANKGALRFWLSMANETNYRDKLADRVTALGDKMYTDSTTPFAFGVKVVPEYHVPDSKLLFTYPQNILLGLHRKVTFRLEERPTEDGVYIVITLRADVKLEEADAAVVINNLSI